MSLGEELSERRIVLSADVCQQLEMYVSELERWNRRINLTSLQGAELRRRLVVEPCWIGNELQMSGTLLDLGSGNGSPGIPLYLSRGFEKAHLVEARTRRAAFLRHIAARLPGDGIVIHKTRIEEMEAMRDVDWVTLQGVKPNTDLLEACRQRFPSTTRVVWITSNDVDAFPGDTCVSVPG